MKVTLRTGQVAGFALSLLMISGSGVTAQTKSVPTMKATADSLSVGNKKYDAEKELARMAKRYSLTEEQKAKVQPILVEQQKRVHTLGEDENLSDAEWGSGVRAAHLLTVSQVKLQLTDAQASKYAKDEAKRAREDGDLDDMQDGPPGPPPGGGGGPGGPGGGGPPGE